MFKIVSKSMTLVLGGAIAAVSHLSPAIAQTPAPAPEPAAAPSLCRATNRNTPVFEAVTTTSNAVKLLPINTQVTLVALPPSGSQFVELKAPNAGFIQTAVLKQCGGTNPGTDWGNIPTTGTACRQAIRPNALNVRSSPVYEAAGGNILTSFTIPKTVYVTTTTGDVVKSYRNNDFIWVQVDLKRTFGGTINGLEYGWMYNTDLKNNPNQSNLIYCK